MLQKPQASHATALSEVQSVGNAAISCSRSAPPEEDDVQSDGNISPVTLQT